MLPECGGDGFGGRCGCVEASAVTMVNMAVWSFLEVMAGDRTRK